MHVTRMRVARGTCTVQVCMVASTVCTQHAHHTSPKARPAASPKWLYERSTRVSEVVLRSACVVHAQCMCRAWDTRHGHGCPARRALGKRWCSHGARAAAASTCRAYAAHLTQWRRSAVVEPIPLERDLSERRVHLRAPPRHVHMPYAHHMRVLGQRRVLAGARPASWRAAVLACGWRGGRRGEAACLHLATQLFNAGQANVVVRKVERRDRRVGGQDLPHEVVEPCGGRRAAWREQGRQWLLQGRAWAPGRAVARSAGRQATSATARTPSSPNQLSPRFSDLIFELASSAAASARAPLTPMP